MCPTAQRQLAAVFSEGAERYFFEHQVNGGFFKYGLPVWDVRNHLENHYNLWQLGDASENHLAKMLWGVVTLIHLTSGCKCHLVAKEREVK